MASGWVEIPKQSDPLSRLKVTHGLDNEMLNRVQAGVFFRPYSLHFLGMNQQAFFVLMGGTDGAIGDSCAGQQCKDGLTASATGWAYNQPEADLFLSAEPTKTAANFSAFLTGSAERGIDIDPFDPAFCEKVMGLTRKTIVSNRWKKCYRLTVIDEFPLRRRQWCDNLLPATTGTGVCANRVLHTYIEHPRFQLIREVLNESRTQTINSLSVHFLAVKDGKSE